MTQTWKDLRIDPDRFRHDFEKLSAIGATADGGVSRPAFSPSHQEARSWLRARINDAGLHFRQDGAGNHFARLECASPGAPALLLGSHLDSVPGGGRFDGALGVLAALEVLRRVKEAGLQLPVNLEMVDFSDEEGMLVSFLGSFALSGKLTPEILADPRGGRVALEAGLARAGLNPDGVLHARRDPQTLYAYLELHIEQGAQLEKAGVPLGVVTSIAGLAFYRMVFQGESGHAGTVPMPERRDAAQGASAFTLAARQVVLDEFPGCFSNVGKVEYQPGAFNIVPHTATLALEFRAQEKATLMRMQARLLQEAQNCASRFGLELDTTFLGKRNPAPMAQACRDAIQAAAARLGLETLQLPSRAGHDAQAMAALCPTGMIFVPSVKGISHAPQEFTPMQGCIRGADALLQAALELAHQTNQGIFNASD